MVGMSCYCSENIERTSSYEEPETLLNSLSGFPRNRVFLKQARGISPYVAPCIPRPFPQEIAGRREWRLTQRTYLGRMRTRMIIVQGAIMYLLQVLRMLLVSPLREHLVVLEDVILRVGTDPFSICTISSVGTYWSVEIVSSIWDLRRAFERIYRVCICSCDNAGSMAVRRRYVVIRIEDGIDRNDIFWRGPWTCLGRPTVGLMASTLRSMVLTAHGLRKNVSNPNK